MSSIERAARVVKVLTEEEWRSLRGIERASMKYGFAEPGMISRLARIPLERAKFALDRLNKRGLIQTKGASFTPTYSAMEALALREYVRRGTIFALGAIIAKGKESDVYEAFTEEGELLALKFFTIGRTSFRDVKRKRFVEGSEIKGWMATNYEAAKREYTALKRLEGLTKSVPRVLAYDRNTVIFQEVNGVKLVERPELEDPALVLRRILDCIRVAFLKGGLINGDLSEYNILTEGRNVWLIDWPQAVRTDHPNSIELLRRDLQTILKFFRRVYGVQMEESEAHLYVTGGRVRRAAPSFRE